MGADVFINIWNSQSDHRSATGACYNHSQNEQRVVKGITASGFFFAITFRAKITSICQAKSRVTYTQSGIRVDT